MPTPPSRPIVPSLPLLEQEVLARWERERIFEKSLEQTKDGKRFVFFEGPPTANGMPHMGHVETRAFKDVILRFKTMQGFRVDRKAGWDTQGLPVELELEKQLKLSGKKDIESYGIAAFNAKARESVWKYKDLWEQMTKRVGFWLDFDHPYITYEADYIETLWWIFKSTFDQGLLEQDYKVVPYCPRCGTALSSHEVAQGYESVEDQAVYVKFEIEDEPGTYLLAWTTTPWTLPGNVALALNPDATYDQVQFESGRTYIVAHERSSEVLKDSVPLGKIVQSSKPIQASRRVSFRKGSELIGKRYKPLFDFLDLRKESGKDAYKVVAGDFVTMEEGTGIVHTAVMYGEDDFQLGKKEDLPAVHTVDLQGRFTDLVKLWAGKEVRDPKNETQDAIVQYLKDHGKLFNEEKVTHDYPFCWRCKHPLLYYAKTSWFIRMSQLRDELIANNAKIEWFPEHIKEGRFGEWLREVKDWAVSRERYWGTPIPIWTCDACDQRVCLGSFAELSEKLGKKLPADFDPHRPTIDEFTFACTSCSTGTMRRIPEVADTWFDSGSMPFAQWHYPFENKEKVDAGDAYPANYITEAIDQTRGWFYTMLAIGTILQKAGVVTEAPYRTCLVLGLIRDREGKKLSKSLGNYIDPMLLINEIGADPVRFTIFAMNQPGEPKNFDVSLVQETVKKTFLILLNVVSFWKLHAKEVADATPTHVLDRWLVNRTHLLTQDVTVRLDRYDITGASRALAVFITDLSTWYVRRSRDRFKAGDASAIATLRSSLLTLAKLLAPFTPFFAETVYADAGGAKESVHLESWPTAPVELDAVVTDMYKLRAVVEVGHALRAQAGIKLRQPLAQAVVTAGAVSEELRGILREELNVVEVHEAPDPTTLQPDFLSAKTAGGVAVAIDVTLTDELVEQGLVREFVRLANDQRKRAKCRPDEQVTVLVSSDDALVRGLVEQYGAAIAEKVRADRVALDGSASGEELDLNGHRLRLAIVRAA